jgi:hypothetical protein
LDEDPQAQRGLFLLVTAVGDDVAARGPYTNAELAALIERITGKQVSHTWGCRNPQGRDAIAGAR